MFSYKLERSAIWTLNFYKKAISPYLPVACRHHPTCSIYAMEAIDQYGLWKGSVLIARRILRCNPLGTKGYDPVP
ncbi:MAG: membrane protein insertion efficiency factor YidD [Chloroflexota bacterium]|nr:membrane protein insertion efficiency factor YidD [Chloroflexota bacterium]MEC9439439.1 membrane protein insertion efficiency factor YidD [Chloroflexota bacterium]